MTIAVELTRPVDGPQVLAALAARGLSGELASACHASAEVRANLERRLSVRPRE